MAGLTKKGPKHKKTKGKNKNKEAPTDLTREDMEFKKLMEEGHIYKKVSGATRQVR